MKFIFYVLNHFSFDAFRIIHLKHFIMYERVLCAVPLRPVNPRHCLHAAEKIVLWFWGRKKCILSEIYDVEVTRNNFNGSVCRR